MSVKDVNTKATALESKLVGKLFLGGAKPSIDDVKLFNDLLGNNNLNLFRWVKNVATFSEGDRRSWGAPLKVKPLTETGNPIPSAAAKPAPVADAKPAPAGEEEDIDFFGEETEEDKAALAAKKAKDAEKKKAKPAVIAKSSILYDIKGWDDTVDLEELAKKLNAIQRDGLVWGDHKLVPVAYGVKKLQQLIVIEDDKVSGDDLEEMITSFENEVQSIDIVAWNKI
ncbi:unnamed protein product [Phytomonas sp. Hart1]|nr:unnamed protein product [Phytomonas sp. Hart1]|eukprot:CCW67585.1 unnamed protein product [Phytomonas sp. isolate Hart1]